MSVSFAKYRKPMSQPLALKEQDEWREKLAGDVIKLAEESAGRDDFLKRLHDAMEAIGHDFVKLGSGTSRAVFGLPFATVLKVCVVGEHGPGTRPALSPNEAESQRSKAFPAFVPKVYGEVYRSLGDQSIDALIAEQVVPLHQITDHLTYALGSTNAANLGVCPRSGRIMVLDVGGAWTEGVEESFLRGDHYLQRFPFMREPRW